MHYRSAALAAGLLMLLGSCFFLIQREPAPGLHTRVLYERSQSNVASANLASIQQVLSGARSPIHGPYPQPSHEALSAAGCVAVSMQYVPSPLEAAQMRDCDQDHCLVERLPGAKEEKDMLLLLLAQQSRNPALLLREQGHMQGVSVNSHSGGTQSRDKAAEAHSLSSFNTTYMCTGSPHSTALTATHSHTHRARDAHAPFTFTVVSYIEPLYGILRHPSAWNCSSNQMTSWPRLMDTTHIVMAANQASLEEVKPDRKSHPELQPAAVTAPAAGTAPAAAVEPKQAPAASKITEAMQRASTLGNGDKSRKFFYFDLGASTYPDLSQSWMHHAYAARGIHFDRIFMWEAASMDTQALFKSVPDEVYAAYQYFHEPVTVDPASKRNPLHLIRTLTRPEDFVAFKLDIDASQIEAHFAEQILQDPEVFSRIDELFWEIHFNEPGMVSCCWGRTADLSVDRCAAMRTFLELRKRGIRAHGWP